MSTKKLAIEIINVSKKLKNRTILKSINLTIYEGEIFGLIGPNGAGKTMLIQTLLGTVWPDRGEIKILGQNLKNNLSWIHQNTNSASAFSRLQEHISPLENLITFAGLYGIRKPEKKVNDLMKYFELDKYIQKNIKTHQLSSGENTRLLLSKSFVNNPKVLFLDEPTAGLDPNMAKKVIVLIKQIQKNKKMTILYASNNLMEIKELCNRIGFIKNGHLIKIVSAKHLYKLKNLY